MNYYLRIIFLLGSMSCGATGSQLFENADTLNRLNALYTTLYGVEHPLHPYLKTHRSLICRHTRSTYRNHQTRTQRSMNTSLDLQVALDTLRDYAQSVLAGYRVPQKDGSQERLTTAPLPLTCNTNLSVTAEQKPAQLDAALQQYLQILLALQQQNPTHHAIMHQKRMRAAQLRLLGFGTLTIIGLTLFIRYIVFNSLRTFERTRDKYGDVSDNAWHTSGRAASLPVEK